jgi:hypothetical protein
MVPKEFINENIQFQCVQILTLAHNLEIENIDNWVVASYCIDAPWYLPSGCVSSGYVHNTRD